jgi:hypothetical protein
VWECVFGEGGRVSKRWKFRQRNAEKRERSREVMDRFFDNIHAELERIKAKAAYDRARLIRSANK